MHTYSRFILLILVLSSVTLACNLSQGSEAQPTPLSLNFTPTTQTLATTAPSTTPTPRPTVANTPSSSSNTQNTSANSAPALPVVGASGAAPVCSLMPVSNVSVNVRENNSLDARVIAALAPNRWIKARSYLNGWYQIESPGTAADGAWIYEEVVSVMAPCTCTPNCVRYEEPAWEYSGPTSACQLTNNGTQAEPLYLTYGGGGYPADIVPVGAYVYAFAQRGGWYKVWSFDTNQYVWIPSGGWMFPSDLSSCLNVPIDRDPSIVECTAIVNPGDPIGLQPQPNYDTVPMSRASAGTTFPVASIQNGWVEIFLIGAGGTAWLDQTLVSFDGDCAAVTK